jgi:flavin-dependent dehydrogenase
VTVYTHAGDPPLKAVRDPARWAALVAACPAHAHWLEGEPITGVLPMAGITDRYRRFVVEGAPVATGVVAVGDAWACTNPSRGRGITMGLMQALGTAEVARQYLGDPLALALAHDEMTETRVTPWYRYTVEDDRLRAAQLEAAISGRDAPERAGSLVRLPVAAVHDADLFRAFLEINSLLALPQEVLARPGLAEQITATAGAHAAVDPPGPSRTELLRMLA